MAEPPVPASKTSAFRAAAWLGFLAVALGAFGAHWLRAVLERRSMAAVWDKAVFYHFVHALAMLALAGVRPFPALAWRLFGVGILCFSGSLYAWALTGIYWLVFVTPLGGLCLLAGWFCLAAFGGKPSTPAVHGDQG